MFTEGEIAYFISNKEINEATALLMKEFKNEEAPYLALEKHDFLSLVMMAPQIGIAMADGNISFWEELSLQRKARKLSKGGFFLSKDPVADSVKYLVKSYHKWEDKFCSHIKLVFEASVEKDDLKYLNNNKLSYSEKLMKSPYQITRFVSSIFLDKDEDVLDPKKVKQSELEKMKVLGQKTGLDSYAFFSEFIGSFQLK